MIALTSASSNVLLLKPGKGAKMQPKFLAQINCEHRMQIWRTAFCLSMSSVDVIPLQYFVARAKDFIKLLEKCGEVSRIAEKFDETDCTQDELCQAGEQHSFFCCTVLKNQLLLWTNADFNVLIVLWQGKKLRWNCKRCLQLQMRANNTSYVYIIKFNSGEEENWIPRNGGGNLRNSGFSRCLCSNPP